MKRQCVDPEFVEFIPPILESGKLYISMIYATTVHLCACGCGNKVVLPLSPVEWQLFYDGETVDISPSVGNGGFPCRSHYWIQGNEIRWSTPLTKKHIAESRRRDAAALANYLGSKQRSRVTTSHPATTASKAPRFLQRLYDWFRI